MASLNYPYLNTIKRLVNLGTNDYQVAADEANAEDHPEIVEYLNSLIE